MATLRTGKTEAIVMRSIFRVAVWCLLFAYVLILGSLSNRAAGSDKINLNNIILNNKSTRESIRTFSATVMSESRESASSPVGPTRLASYCRNGDQIATRDTFPGGQI